MTARLVGRRVTDTRNHLAGAAIVAALALIASCSNEASPPEANGAASVTVNPTVAVRGSADPSTSGATDTAGSSVSSGTAQAPDHAGSSSASVSDASGHSSPSTSDGLSTSGPANTRSSDATTRATVATATDSTVSATSRPPSTKPGTAQSTPTTPTTHPSVSLPPQTSISLASSASFTVTVPPSLQPGSSPIVKAYIGGWRFSDKATAHPSADWSHEASQYMTDPIRSEFLQTLHKYASRGQHTVGHVAVTATLKSVKGPSATIVACVDISHQDMLNKNGESIVAANGPGSYWRYIETAHMKRISGTWLLSTADSNWNKTC